MVLSIIVGYLALFMDRQYSPINYLIGQITGNRFNWPGCSLSCLSAVIIAESAMDSIYFRDQIAGLASSTLKYRQLE
jgi:hypothetical protein